MIIIIPMSSCSHQSDSTELTISAAASLTNVMEEIVDLYEEKEAIRITINLGGSGSLSEQIIQGAPADVFLSASTDKFQRAVDAGSIDTSTIRPLLSNQLVWIQRKDTQHQSLASLEKIAIGIPASVPAGYYAKQALVNADIYQSIQSKIVQTKDVRQVVQYVQSENVDVGIAYQTDAMQFQDIAINHQLPLGDYSDIIYPVGITQQAQNREAAEKFLAFLQTDQVQQIFQKYGFSTVGEVDGSLFSTD